MSDFLHQTSEPLFPKVFWEKPINKRAAKKLLIIGGHANEFSAMQMAYAEALAAGIGEAKVILPDSLLRLTGNREDCLFVPSTKSGSLAKSSLEEIERYISESDGVLLAGEFSENTETVSLLESLVYDCKVPLIISQQAINSLHHNVEAISRATNRLLIANSQTLVKLCGTLEVEVAIKVGQNLLNKIDILKRLSEKLPLDCVLSGAETIVCSNNKISVTSTTRVNSFGDGTLATFWLQHNDKFEALTSGCFVLSKAQSVEEIKVILSQLMSH